MEKIEQEEDESGSFGLVGRQLNDATEGYHIPGEQYISRLGKRVACPPHNLIGHRAELLPHVTGADPARLLAPDPQKASDLQK